MTGPEREFSRDYDDHIEKLESIITVLVYCSTVLVVTMWRLCILCRPEK
jgi:hypothetical protein